MLSYKFAKFKENPCVGTNVSTPLYKIKAKTEAFHSIVKYASYHICIICVFMNFNKNAKNQRKIIKNINMLISSQYCHCCMF